MKYKALFLDVDGTTVIHGIDNLPSPRVTKAVVACEQAGVTVSLATSRPPRSVVHIISHLSLTGYCVLSSGSEIYDPRLKKVIIRKVFPNTAIEPILDVARAMNEKVKIYDGTGEFVYDGGHLPKTIVGMYFPEVAPKKMPELTNKISDVPGISVHRMEAWNQKFECLDIVTQDTSKLHGIVEVSRLLGVETHEIIGVGDGYNDFPLLMACGLKIAMGNAVPELKAIADFVAPTVEEDGVAVVIEKFILAG